MSISCSFVALPKGAKTAINQAAFRHSQTLAYDALKIELEALAADYWMKPGASVEQLSRMLARAVVSVQASVRTEFNA